MKKPKHYPKVSRALIPILTLKYLTTVTRRLHRRKTKRRLRNVRSSIVDLVKICSTNVIVLTQTRPTEWRWTPIAKITPVCVINLINVYNIHIYRPSFMQAVSWRELLWRVMSIAIRIPIWSLRKVILRQLRVLFMLVRTRNIWELRYKLFLCHLYLSSISICIGNFKIYLRF